MHVPDWAVGSGAAIVASAAVRALPEPQRPMGSRLYLWFYRFTHALLANFDRVSATETPR